jgi:helix-turn-helix protein
MSVRVMSWVWESSLSEGIDRLVLLAIADSASDHGGDAWPSVHTLARKAAVSERTVQRAVRSLVELGELEVRANAGKHGVNVYRVNMSPRHAVTPDSVSPPSDSHPVTLSPRQPVTPSDSRSTPVTQSPPPRQADTRTVLEPSLPVPQNSSSEPAARADVERICQHLADRIEANGSKRPTIGKTWRDEARRLIDLDGRTEQQIITAIDWCQSHPFWRSNILSMPKLREKYDQLRLAAQRTPGRTPQQETDDHFARAAARMGVAQ